MNVAAGFSLRLGRASRALTKEWLVWWQPEPLRKSCRTAAPGCIWQARAPTLQYIAFRETMLHFGSDFRKGLNIELWWHRLPACAGAG